jgi:hypothetical protein
LPSAALGASRRYKPLGAAVDFEGGPVKGLLVDGVGMKKGELGVAQR